MQQDNSIYETIPQLKISPQGIFKYILIKCKNNNQIIATFVRGDIKHEYHAENYKAFATELKKAGFTDVKKKEEIITAKKGGNSYEFICPGGGRIEHNYDGKKCSVYGYSQTYGYVDHKEAQSIIANKLGYGLEEIRLNEKDY